LGEYLAFLSAKFSVDPDKFFQALVSLKESEKVACESLSILFRGRIREERIFLMTVDSGMVGQFRVPESFLSEDTNPIRESMDCDRVRRYLAKKAYVVQSGSIGSLCVGMRHIALHAKILDIQKPGSVLTRFGELVAVANALIGDKTGTIKLCLWDDQISAVSKGDAVFIKDAQAFAFRGEKQLRLGRNGTISIEQEKAISA
jgi:replication factor A1